MKSGFSKTLLLIFAAILLGSWGDTGHEMISFRINLSFNEEMTIFNDWIFYLSAHASDADWRKKDDPEEGPRHYIDIDNYDGFVQDGYIPQTLEDCISEYGAGFVDDNGYLPWATLAMYDSVVNCLQRTDWESAKKYAADLGHYVADGHMPMHITRNYDGQLTGNKGIHARYEIYMIQRFQDQIEYEGWPAEEIGDVRSYIFDYLYSNYDYVDTILIADDYATEMASGNSSDLYYEALWERTGRMTKMMFRDASHAIAELLYTAWLEAGKPGDETHAGDPGAMRSLLDVNIYPNPVSGPATISFSNPRMDPLLLTIFDASGRERYHRSTGPGIGERTSFNWDPGDISNGVYYLVLGNGQVRDCKSFILQR